MSVLIVFICVLIVMLLFLLYVYDTAFCNSKRKRKRKNAVDLGEQFDALKDKIRESSRELEATEGEKVYITSYDGLRLSGTYYHFRDGAPLDIIFHGYRSGTVSDCGGGFVLARDLGHNVLLPDHRAHGESEGCTITFGIKERFDCLYWTRYASSRFENVKIVISGVSMGAATVLMASDLDLPPNVKGIIADCAFSSPEEIILSEAKKMGFSPRLAAPFIKLSARIFAGISLNEASAVKAVSNAKIPILIAHGEDDRFVPCEMAWKIYDACASTKRIFTVKDAGHGLSFIVEAERYKKEINDFKTKVLSGELE